MKRIIYTHPDGRLMIIMPAYDAQLENESVDEFIKRIFVKDVPKDAINSQIIDTADVPTDRYFRDAWHHVDGKIEHNLEKCCWIYKERLRESRKPLLQALDAESIQALENNDTSAMTEIKKKKQALRDITEDPRIEKAKTPEELRKLWPF